MKNVLCFLVMAAFLAQICARPDDKATTPKPKDAVEKAKKAADAAEGAAKKAEGVAKGAAKKAEEAAEGTAKKVEKGAEDSEKVAEDAASAIPHKVPHDQKHKKKHGLVSSGIKVIQEVVDDAFSFAEALFSF